VVKGIIYIAISNVIWILSAFGIHVGLGRFLGPRLYGIFGIIIAILSISHLILSNGLNHAVTKFTSQHPTLSKRIRFEGLKIQGAISVAIAVGLIFFSGTLSGLLKEESLKGLIRFSALIIPCAGTYYIYTGFFLGVKNYGFTAVLNSLYALLKVILVALFVLLGMQLYGVIFGFFLSVLITCSIAILSVKNEDQERAFSSRTLVKFALPVMIFYIATALLAHMDIFFVKSMLTGQSHTGFYASAQAISKIIYFAFVAFNVVLLPTFSDPATKNDPELSELYLHQSMRFMLLLLGPIIILLNLTGGVVLSLLYGKAFLPASYPMGILVFGVAFWAISSALAAILQGRDRQRIPTYVFLALIPMDIVLQLILIPKFELAGAALATCSTFFVGMVALSVGVFIEHGSLIRVMSFCKISFSWIVLYFILHKLIVILNLPFLAFWLIGFSIYFCILVLVREICMDDIHFLKRLLKEGRFGPQTFGA